jgi:hypothetical protein
MGATPTARAADTGAGAARVSATSAHAELTGRHAETLRPLPRPAQRQPPRARRPLPGDQEAHQEGDQGNPGRLTRRDQPPTTADLVSGEVPTPAGLNHKLRLSLTKTTDATAGRRTPGDALRPIGESDSVGGYAGTGSAAGGVGGAFRAPGGRRAAGEPRRVVDDRSRPESLLAEYWQRLTRRIAGLKMIGAPGAAVVGVIGGA